MNKIFQILSNEKGSTLYVLFTISLVAIIMASTLTLLNNTRKSVNNEVFRDQRSRIIKRNHSFLKSRYILDYSLNVKNSPTDNPDLAKCILSAIPETDCPRTLNFPFFEPMTNGQSQKIVGDQTSPAFTDHFGTSCQQEDNNCIFQIQKECQFKCPAGQSVCPTLKVMLCDVEVKLLEQSFLKTIKFKEIQGQFVTSSTVRLQKTASGALKYYVTNE